jgi:hypothetical protein
MSAENNHARAGRYRKLALAELDKEKAGLLNRIPRGRVSGPSASAHNPARISFQVHHPDGSDGAIAAAGEIKGSDTARVLRCFGPQSPSRSLQYDHDRAHRRGSRYEAPCRDAALQ